MRIISDVISFSCERCGLATRVPVEHAGRRGRCGGCREVLRVPGSAQGQAAEPPARCRGCARGLRAGLDYCARCTRPTILRLVLVSLAFLTIGAPLAAVCGVITLAAADEGQVIRSTGLFSIVGGIAAGAGAVDLVRALVALATGQDEVQPLATQWVLARLD